MDTLLELMHRPRLPIRLEGTDGNAFSLLAAFTRAARKQGWTMQNIKMVTDEAKKGDYSKLVRTLTAYTLDTEPANVSEDV